MTTPPTPSGAQRKRDYTVVPGVGVLAPSPKRVIEDLQDRVAALEARVAALEGERG